MIQYFSKIEIESINNQEKLSTYIHLSPTSTSGIFQIHYLKLFGFQLTNLNLLKLLINNLQDIDIENEFIFKPQGYSNFISLLGNFIDLKAIHYELVPFSLYKNENNNFFKNSKIYETIYNELNDKEKLYLDGIISLSNTENEPNFNLGMKYLIKGGKIDSEPCLIYILLGCFGFLNLDNSNYPLACSIFIQILLNTGLIHQCGKYIYSPALEVFCKGLDNLYKFKKYLLERLKNFTNLICIEENFLNFNKLFDNKEIQIENIIIYLLIQPNRKSRNWKNCFRLLLNLNKYQSCSKLFIITGDILRLFNNDISINISFLTFKSADYLFKSKNFKILSIYLLNQLIKNVNYLNLKVIYKIKKFSFNILKKYEMFNSELIYILLYLTTYGLNPDLKTIFNEKILNNNGEYVKKKKIKSNNLIEKIILNYDVDFKAINILIEIILVTSKPPGFLFALESAKICKNYKLMELIISNWSNKIKCNKSKIGHSIFIYEDQPSNEQISNSIDAFIDLFNEYKENYKNNEKNNYTKNILNNEFELKITKYYAIYRLFIFVSNFLLDSKFKEISIDFYLSVLGLLINKLEYYYWEKKIPKIINLYILGKLLKIGKYDNLSYSILLLCVSIPKNDITSRFFKSKALYQLLLFKDLNHILNDLNVIYGYLINNKDFKYYSKNINNLFLNLINYFDAVLKQNNHLKNINYEFLNHLFSENNYEYKEKDENFGSDFFPNIKNNLNEQLLMGNIINEIKKITNTIKSIENLNLLSEIYKELDIRMIFGKFSNILKKFDHNELAKNYKKEFKFTSKELFNFNIINKFLKSYFKDFKYEIFRYIELIKNNEMLRIYKENEIEIDKESEEIKLDNFVFKNGHIIKYKQNVKILTKEYDIEQIDLLIYNIKFINIYNPLFLRIIGLEYSSNYNKKLLKINYIFEDFETQFKNIDIKEINNLDSNILRILYGYFICLINTKEKNICKLEYLVINNDKNVKIFNPYFISEFENNLKEDNGFTYSLDNKNLKEQKEKEFEFLNSKMITFDFGFILYYIITKKNLKEKKDIITNNNIFDQKIKKISQKYDFYKNIIIQCIKINPNERIELYKLINIFEKKADYCLNIYNLNKEFFYCKNDNFINKLIDLPCNLSIINTYNKGNKEYFTTKIYFKNELIINGNYNNDNYKSYYLILNENKTVCISSLKEKIILLNFINKFENIEKEFKIYVNHNVLNLLLPEQYTEYLTNFEESTNLKSIEKWYLRGDESGKTFYDKTLEFFKSKLLLSFNNLIKELISPFKEDQKINMMDLFGNQSILSFNNKYKINFKNGIYILPFHPKLMFNQFFYNKNCNENIIALLKYESFGFLKLINPINNYIDLIETIKLEKIFKYIGGDYEEHKYIGHYKNKNFEGIIYNKNGDYHSKFNKNINFIYYKKKDLLYKGLIKNKLPNGIGELINNNKTIYQGNFFNGIPNGFGILLSKNENLIFKGIFKNGYPYFGFYLNQLKVYEGMFFKENKKKIKDITSLLKIFSYFKDNFTIIGTVINYNNKIFRIKGILNKLNINLKGNYEIYTKDNSLYIGKIDNNIKKGLGILFCNNGMIIKGLWSHPYINGVVDFSKNNKDNYTKLENEYQKTMNTFTNINWDQSFTSKKDNSNKNKESINLLNDFNKKSSFRSNINSTFNQFSINNFENNMLQENSIDFINTYQNNKNKLILKNINLDLNNPKKIKGIFNFTDEGNIIFKKFGVIYLSNGLIYKGEFYKNIIHGFGSLVINEHSYYKGQFDQNKILGFGIYQKNSNLYCGEFLNSKKNGFGIEIYNNKIIKGLWIQNELKFFNLNFKKNYKNCTIKKLILDYDEKNDKNYNYCHIVYKYKKIKKINYKNNDVLKKFKEYFKKVINVSKFKIDLNNKKLNFYGKINKNLKKLIGVIFIEDSLFFQGKIDINLEKGFGIVIDNINQNFEKLGYIKNFMINGIGSLNTEENSKEGYFSSDLPNKFILTKINDELIFKGFYKNGKKEGYCIKYIDTLKRFCYFENGQLKNIYWDYN